MTQPVPGQVTVVDTTGRGFTVPIGQAAAAEAQGYRVETPEETAQRRYSQQAGLGEEALALGQGVASGLTFGGTDYLAGQVLSEEAKANMLRREQEFTGASLAGQTIGALAPALFSGGSSLAASGGSLGGRAALTAGRVATAPGRAVTALAERAGAAAGRAVLGAGEAGTARQIAATATRMGIEGGIEAGVGAAGAAAGHASLANEELDAQMIAAAFGEGALFGGLPMAGIGALGKGAAIAGRAAAPTAKGLANAILPESIPTLLKRTADAQTIKGYTGATGADMRQMLTRAGRDPNVRRDELAVRLRDTFGPELDLMSLERKAGAIGARLDDAGKMVAKTVDDAEAAGAVVDAARTMGRVRRVTDRLRASKVAADATIADAIDGYVARISETITPKQSRAYIRAERQAVALERKAAKSEARLRKLQEEAAATESARVDKATGIEWEGGGTVGKKLRAAIEKVAGEHDAARKLATEARATADSLITAPSKPPTLKELLDLERRIDRDINWQDKAATARNEALTSVRFALKDEIDEAIGQASPEALEAFRKANREFGDWKDLDRIVVKRVAAEDGNRYFGLSDNVLAAGGIASGNVLAGAAGALTSKVMRSSGASAWVGRKLSAVGKAQALREASAQARRATSLQVARAVGARLGKGAKAAAPRTLAAYDQLQERAERLKANRDAYIQALSEQAADLDGVGTLASTYVQQQLRVSQFLADSLPRPIDTGAPTIGVKRVPPASEIARWQRQARAVTAPMTVVEDLRDGTLTRDAVAALEATQPQLLEAIRSEVEAELVRQVERDKPPTAQALAQISVLLGRPVDASQMPQFVAAQQAMFASGPQQDETGQTVGGPGVMRPTGVESGASERAALPAESALV